MTLTIQYKDGKIERYSFTEKYVDYWKARLFLLIITKDI